ncbi:MAG TPA: hypothetical protein VGP30_05175, partial [Candidatus Limnocylindrales bacterium]|nr:hypothetical protein [Candidatus Limnocylindrales bacterium]
TSAHATARRIAPEIASLSLRVADAQAVGSSRRRPSHVEKQQRRNARTTLPLVARRGSAV